MSKYFRNPVYRVITLFWLAMLLEAPLYYSEYRLYLPCPESAFWGKYSWCTAIKINEPRIEGRGLLENRLLRDFEKNINQSNYVMNAKEIKV